MNGGKDKVVSLVYGADEFLYVLGKCLFNYGGVIGAGMYQSAVSVRQTTISFETRTEGNGNDASDQTAPSVGKQQTSETKSEERPHKTKPPHTKPSDSGPEGKPNVAQTEQQQGPGPARAKLDWTNWSKPAVGKDTESEKHDVELRETVQGMKVDFEDDDSVLDLADIAGLDAVKQALEEFACFFLHFPHLTRNLRQRSTTGILLFGPQGTGKTLLVKSFAKKFNLAVYDIRASAIMSKFVGESEKFIRALFKEVRANAPAVLFLDECDGLLCNPSADATQSHNYRLLQNELKNQWSDLMYSRDEVIVVGATNKPHDIDMDGFGRRLSLKLHVALPSEKGCEMILKGALDRLRHQLQQDDFRLLGALCYDRGLSGYDIDCLVEGMLRKAMRALSLTRYYTKMAWKDGTIAVPCEENTEGAVKGPWIQVVDSVEDVSYRPFAIEEVKAAILRSRATVDEAMMQKHVLFASQYGTEED